MPRPARLSPDRILAASALEFSERGFAGARVDRIAHRARVNKAMLYYHFTSKQRLYRTLLRRMFTRAAERLQSVAAGHHPPAVKVDRAIAAMAAFIDEHAFFPAIMLREVAEGGMHLDRETLKALGAVPRAVAAAVAAAASCRQRPPADRARVSGQVEATDVQVAAQVGGRLIELRVREGDRVNVGDVIARLDTADAEIALARVRAERAQADAQRRLLVAGTRPEDIRQADAQAATAETDVRAAEAELAAAQADVDRFEALLAANSGSRKQRDDAVTRRDVAKERLQGARDRVRAARENVARLRAGARREDIEAAQARVTAISAQIAAAEKAIADATVSAPTPGVVTETLADAGELLQPRAPLVVITDLVHAWANVYIDEPLVPRIRLGQPATVFTDAGGPGASGTISYISSKAEFTPRNVQTAEDRSKLVYRLKISLDNRKGVFKAGMPVEAEIPFQDAR